VRLEDYHYSFNLFTLLNLVSRFVVHLFISRSNCFSRCPIAIRMERRLIDVVSPFSSLSLSLALLAFFKSPSLA
jgi:hypothetical protein